MCPNHKNSHGKHYSHKSAWRTNFEKKDILATFLIYTELRKVGTPKSKEIDLDFLAWANFIAYIANTVLFLIHVKGHINEMVMWLEDEAERIQNLVKLFFHELLNIGIFVYLYM